MSDNFDRLWRESIERHVAAMTDAEFEALQTVRRETNFASKDLKDPADRQRAVMASINAKQQRAAARGPVNANGYRPGEHPSDHRPRPQ